MQEAIWIITPPSQQAEKISVELDLPLAISKVLVNRRIFNPDSAFNFLFASLDDLHSPYRMKDMKKAVRRIKEAISKGERILIFGDYDVDGILSIVILTKALKSLGAEVSYFIPNRLKDGYGLKEKYMSIVEEKRASLVMSVDCGIKATAFVSRARRKGIDVVITDHHQPGSELPSALAILNPVLPNCDYPDKRLAGVGVVFKLIQTLMDGYQGPSELSSYLKMVSIATIADVAALRGE
ncbi:MAG: DHH family phosphoesterase, partial [Candidatus Aminicenantales bacterium]